MNKNKQYKIAYKINKKLQEIEQEIIKARLSPVSIYLPIFCYGWDSKSFFGVQLKTPRGFTLAIQALIDQFDTIPNPNDLCQSGNPWLSFVTSPINISYTPIYTPYSYTTTQLTVTGSSNWTSSFYGGSNTGIYGDNSTYGGIGTYGDSSTYSDNRTYIPSTTTTIPYITTPPYTPSYNIPHSSFSSYISSSITYAWRGQRRRDKLLAVLTKDLVILAYSETVKSLLQWVIDALFFDKKLPANVLAEILAFDISLEEISWEDYSKIK